MLATLGFLITAILLILFALTFDNLVKKDNKELRTFGLGYAFVAVAFLVWGLLSLTSATNTTLARSVIVGDALLFLASICVAVVLIPKKWKTAFYILGGILTVLLLVVRAKQYYPTPRLVDGILFFNTQRPVAILLSAIVVFAWLPACMKVARLVTAKSGLLQYYSFYVAAYAITIISASLFIQARRRTIVIESFVAFGVSILLLLISNLLVDNTKKVKAVKNATR